MPRQLTKIHAFWSARSSITMVSERYHILLSNSDQSPLPERLRVFTSPCSGAPFPTRKRPSLTRSTKTCASTSTLARRWTSRVMQVKFASPTMPFNSPPQKRTKRAKCWRAECLSATKTPLTQSARHQQRAIHRIVSDAAFQKKSNSRMPPLSRFKRHCHCFIDQ